MKKISTNFAFSLSPPLLKNLKSCALLLSNLLEFSFPLQKRIGVRNNMYSPKDLQNNICLFLCVPVGTF